MDFLKVSDNRALMPDRQWGPVMGQQEDRWEMVRDRQGQGP